MWCWALPAIQTRHPQAEFHPSKSTGFSCLRKMWLCLGFHCKPLQSLWSVAKRAILVSKSLPFCHKSKCYSGNFPPWWQMIWWPQTKIYNIFCPLYNEIPPHVCPESNACQFHSLTLSSSIMEEGGNVHSIHFLHTMHNHTNLHHVNSLFF